MIVILAAQSGNVVLCHPAVHEISMVANHRILTEGRVLRAVVRKVIAVVIAHMVRAAFRADVRVVAHRPASAAEIRRDRRRSRVLER